MDEFYLVTSNHIYGESAKMIKLKETPKFFIDESGVRFKKEDGKEYLASRNSSYGFNYSSSCIYSVDHEKPKQIIKKEKQKYFSVRVQDIVSSKMKKMSYDDFVKLAEFLNIKLEK